MATGGPTLETCGLMAVIGGPIVETGGPMVATCSMMVITGGPRVDTGGRIGGEG